MESNARRVGAFAGIGDGHQHYRARRAGAAAKPARQRASGDHPLHRFGGDVEVAFCWKGVPVPGVTTRCGRFAWSGGGGHRNAAPPGPRLGRQISRQNWSENLTKWLKPAW